MTKRISKADNIKCALSGDNSYIASVDPGETFVVECAINANDGIVKEGFKQVGAEPAVNESVREAAKRLVILGTILAHLTAATVWTPIGTEGMIRP
jgi:amidase